MRSRTKLRNITVRWKSGLLTLALPLTIYLIDVRAQVLFHSEGQTQLGTVRAVGMKSQKYNMLSGVFQWDMWANFTEAIAFTSGLQ